jgi:hypothetical protein
MIETNGEVVGVVGVLGLEVMGLEIRLLRLRPLRLVRIQVAEYEMQERRGLAGDELLEARFRGGRVRPAHESDQRALRDRVTRIDLQYAQVLLHRVVAAVFLRGDIGEPEERVDVERLGLAQLRIERARLLDVARLQQLVRLGQRRIHPRLDTGLRHRDALTRGGCGGDSARARRGGRNAGGFTPLGRACAAALAARFGHRLQ